MPALRDRFGALYWLLVALAWQTATVVTPALLLRTAVMNDNDYYTAWVPSMESAPQRKDRFKVGDIVDVHCSPRRRKIHQITLVEAAPR